MILKAKYKKKTLDVVKLDEISLKKFINIYNKNTIHIHIINKLNLYIFLVKTNTHHTFNIDSHL